MIRTVSVVSLFKGAPVFTKCLLHLYIKMIVARDVWL
jgi:hypothetical protein